MWRSQIFISELHNLFTTNSMNLPTYSSGNKRKTSEREYEKELETVTRSFSQSSQIGGELTKQEDDQDTEMGDRVNEEENDDDFDTGRNRKRHKSNQDDEAYFSKNKRW